MFLRVLPVYSTNTFTYLGVYASLLFSLFLTKLNTSSYSPGLLSARLYVWCGAGCACCWQTRHRLCVYATRQQNTNVFKCWPNSLPPPSVFTKLCIIHFYLILLLSVITMCKVACFEKLLYLYLFYKFLRFPEGLLLLLY